MLRKDLHIGTHNADEREAQKNVRRHPGPAGVPAFEQGQQDTEPDPVERDGSGSARSPEGRKTSEPPGVRQRFTSGRLP